MFQSRRLLKKETTSNSHLSITNSHVSKKQTTAGYADVICCPINVHKVKVEPLCQGAESILWNLLTTLLQFRDKALRSWTIEKGSPTREPSLKWRFSYGWPRIVNPKFQGGPSWRSPLCLQLVSVLWISVIWVSFIWLIYSTDYYNLIWKKLHMVVLSERGRRNLPED